MWIANRRTSGLVLAMIAVALVAILGCTEFIRWRPVYGGATLDRDELSLSFGSVAMRCSFGLWNAFKQPTAMVEIKNLSTKRLDYDFTHAAISSGKESSVRKSSSDARGSLVPGEKARLEIEFKKMVGVMQHVKIDGKEPLKWSSSPLTVQLGTIVVGDTVLVVPDLVFSDRYEDKFL